MVVVGSPEVPAELLDHLHRARAVLVASRRGQEVALVSQAVRADRASFGQGERGAEVLAQVAADGSGGQLDPEPDAARDHRDLAGRHGQRPELGVQGDRACFGHEQQLPRRASTKFLRSSTGSRRTGVRPIPLRVRRSPLPPTV